MTRRCITCCRGLPEWDTHTRCSQHRECHKLRPCAACTLWSGQTWALAEAWHKTHPPIQRAPALVPDRDLSADAVVTPASPGEASLSSIGASVEIHASGDSDWETGDDPKRKRAWRPDNVTPDNVYISGQSQTATSGGPQIGDFRGTGEPPGSLQPLATRNSRTPTVGWHGPPAIGGVNGKPTDQQVVELTSLTSAVGRLTPPRIGGVSGRARDRAPSGGALPPGAAGPGLSQAGSLLESQLWPSQPTSTASLPIAGPARLGETANTANLTKNPRRGTKRDAVDPTPTAPPTGKKKKRVGKKAKSKKDKMAKPHKGSGAVSDCDLYAMMQLIAVKHGWAIGDPPTPAETGPAQAGLSPASMAPPLTGQQPRPNQAPAALGAPPGEEAFPFQAPAVPAGMFIQPEDPIITEASASDWSSQPGLSPAESDVWSVTSGTPSLLEQEATPGLKHLSEEAEALLLRYMSEFYSVQPDTAEQQPCASMLFRSGSEPDPGIPLTVEFKREQASIAGNCPRPP